MGDNARDGIYDALIPLLKNGIMVVALKEALAAKGLAIQSADEAEGRVAAAERKGMERAAQLLLKRADKEFVGTVQHSALHDHAAAIRADAAGFFGVSMETLERG